MTERFRDPAFQKDYDRGQRNAEEHMDRMLSDRNLIGCPCLTCRHGRRVPERQEAVVNRAPPKQIEAHWSD